MTEMSKQAMEQKKAYLRQWREKNREKIREYSRGYYRSHKQEKQEANARYWNKKAAKTGREG